MKIEYRRRGKVNEDCGIIKFLALSQKIKSDEALDLWMRFSENEKADFRKKYAAYRERKRNQEIMDEEAQRKRYRHEAFERNLPEQFKGARLSDFKDTDFAPYMGSLLRDDRNWVLLGTNGIGKTRLAYALCRRWMEEEETYEIITGSEFSSTVNELFRNGMDVCRQIRNRWGMGLKHLIIDEVDKIRGDKNDFSFFSYLIDYRYQNNLQTLVFGNKGDRSAEEILGASAYSRLTGDGAETPIYIRGKDRRKENVK